MVMGARLLTGPNGPWLGSWLAAGRVPVGAASWKPWVIEMVAIKPKLNAKSISNQYPMVLFAVIAKLPCNLSANLNAPKCLILRDFFCWVT